MNKMIKLVPVATLFLFTLLVGQAALAETAVIVHPSNADNLTVKDIQRIYLGKQKSFPSGAKVLPVDQNKGSASRSAFFETILEKNEQQLKAYWSRLVFTGKGTPPKAVGDSAAIKALVSQNPSTIGYVDASAIDDSVKVVHKF